MIKYVKLMKKHGASTTLFRAGVLIFCVVTIKSIVEINIGDVVFSNLHLGGVGTPIVESHLGGVIGGVVSFIILNFHRGPTYFKGSDAEMI